LAELDGEATMAQRRTLTKSKLPAFVQATMAEFSFSERISYLMSKTEQKLILKDVTRSSGVPYSDSFIIYCITEVY